jgi:hypothetical protein
VALGDHPRWAIVDLAKMFWLGDCCFARHRVSETREKERKHYPTVVFSWGPKKKNTGGLLSLLFFQLFQLACPQGRPTGGVSAEKKLYSRQHHTAVMPTPRSKPETRDTSPEMPDC